jgi:histidine phosphotransferase ChpT
MSDIEIAELLAAKFCHDIIGPVGAINNGIEFLSEENFEMKDQALALLEQSAKEASARLQFFRQAYGVVNGEGEANLDQIHSLVQNFFGCNPKLTLDWPDYEQNNPAALPLRTRSVRVLFNLMAMTANALLYGGAIAVRLYRSEGSDVIEVTGRGKLVKCDEETKYLIRGMREGVTLSPRNIQPYYTYLIGSGLEMNLSCIANEQSIQFKAVRPTRGR